MEEISRRKITHDGFYFRSLNADYLRVEGCDFVEYKGNSQKSMSRIDPFTQGFMISRRGFDDRIISVDVCEVDREWNHLSTFCYQA